MRTLLLENDTVKIEIEDGIALLCWKISFVNLKEAQQVVEYRLECTNCVPYPLLIDIRTLKHATKEARDFLASEKGCESAIAGALLVDSILGRMMGNFFIYFSKPLRPTMLFTNEAEAKKWLTRYVSIN